MMASAGVFGGGLLPRRVLFSKHAAGAVRLAEVQFAYLASKMFLRLLFFRS